MSALLAAKSAITLPNGCSDLVLRFGEGVQRLNRLDQLNSGTSLFPLSISKKSPMELINEVPPIKVEGRIVACEGDNNPALELPIEFICLDLKEPAVCKYCGLPYVQEHHH
ncbi:NADH dehydrogenase [ubiquinone] iron-sulfur protein 6, mitochondrial-like [Durio zibethinus]|uniref:NADH dehydrogenase [ubiquinone] iron-sulfur protein 6, mitochondrial-like n=1 Tax=Durio zibethinus TaxID=66656 RepID=A0A6P5YWC1_DURZI|nr:NADH dehydrogenase [ubiquinone] iron-sulfur protein 6, mitochondrial-like [Durio zibethinus]